MQSGLGSLLLLTVTVVAQVPKRGVVEVCAGLAGTEAAMVAWAAHDARRLGDQSLRGPLLTTLERWSSDRTAEKSRTCLHLLDALIGLGARVPAERVAPFVDDADCGMAAFVLLAREPQQNERLLLEMFRAAWLDEHGTRRPYIDLRTWAIGNLLAAQRAPGFARVVATELNQDLDVRIATVKPAAELTTVLIVDYFDVEPLSGYPDKPVYELEHVSTPAAARCLAPGPVAIDSVRSTRDTLEEASRRVTIRPWAGVHDDGLGWLQLLAGTPASASRCMSLDEVDERRFVTDVVKARDGLQRFVDDLRTRLVARGAMSADDAKRFEHTVAVRIEDNRPGPPALPKIPEAR